MYYVNCASLISLDWQLVPAQKVKYLRKERAVKIVLPPSLVTSNKKYIATVVVVILYIVLKINLNDK